MKRRPSPLTLLLFAVVLALGIAGTATAAQVIDGKHIKAGTVTSKQLKNGTVKKKDLAKSVTKQLGIPGPAGPQGPAGPASLPKAQVVSPANTPLAANTQTQVAFQLLQASTYVTTGTAILTSTVPGVGSCVILVGGAVQDEGQFEFEAGGGRTTFTLVAVVNANPAQSPSIVCETPGAGAASDVSLISIPLAS